MNNGLAGGFFFMYSFSNMSSNPEVTSSMSESDSLGRFLRYFFGISLRLSKVLLPPIKA